MTRDDCEWHARWRPASGHPGGWRVWREFHGHLARPRGPNSDTARGPSGKIRLFRTMEAAQRAADQLNKES